MGCRHDPDVDGDRLSAADTFDHPLLQESKELDLRSQGHVANFIEKQRAALRHFDLSDGGLDRSGESASFMAEELRLQKGFGYRRAIYRDKAALRTGALRVDRFRQKFLSSPGGAQQHDGGLGIRHLLDRSNHGHHFRRSGDDTIGSGG